MKRIILGLFAVTALWACKNEKEAQTTSKDTATTTAVAKKESKDLPAVNPIGHATMVLNWGDTVIYVDPVGGADRFSAYDSPDLILVTDFHGDHFNPETLAAVSTEKTTIVLPQDCARRLPESFNKTLAVLANDETKSLMDVAITGIPMYNLREEDKDKHVKGRGNGYLLEADGLRVYISGDTEDIPEMRNLKDIDMAFVCMNLPYTMTVESAADAVIEFAPTTVYPYHYRGAGGLSDVDKFKEIVNAAQKEITVKQLDWYAQ